MYENITPHKTAGQIQNEIFKKDFGSYTAYDLGYALCDGDYKDANECLQKHVIIFNEHSIKKIVDEKFCLVMQYASDPLLASVVRRKFYCVPWLPDPRPMQSVWLYDHGNIKFLWGLPNAMKMAELSETFVVPKEYERMKSWCDSWFEKTFWNDIRKMHGIQMLTQMNFLRTHWKELSKFADNSHLAFDADTSYLPEVRIKKLKAMGNAGSNQLINNVFGKAN